MLLLEEVKQHMIQSYNVTNIESYQVTKLPSNQVTKLPIYQIAKLPSYQVAKFLSYKVTKLPSYNFFQLMCKIKQIVPYQCVAKSLTYTLLVINSKSGKTKLSSNATKVFFSFDLHKKLFHRDDMFGRTFEKFKIVLKNHT